MSTHSPVLRVGPWLICSGVIGRRSDGEIPTDPEQQYRVAFDTLTDRLQAADASWADVIDMITFHVGYERLDHREIFRRVLAEFVRAPYPAWTAIGVAALSTPETLVEIKVVAYRGGRKE